MKKTKEIEQLKKTISMLKSALTGLRELADYHDPTAFGEYEYFYFQVKEVLLDHTETEGLIPILNKKQQK